MRFDGRHGLSLCAALLVAACATLPPQIPEAASCRTNFLGLDEKIDAAEVRDGGARRIAGFPYLRVDRFLASFRDELGNAPVGAAHGRDAAAFDTWVEHLRQLDLTARRAELRNLGWDDPSEEIAHLDRCGRDWAARDLADPARRAQLRQAAVVPDDYSLLRRALGFYPVAVPFLNLGIDGFNDEVRADYARPLPLLDAPGRLVLWTLQGVPVGGVAGGAVGAAHGRDGSRDALGIPRLSHDEWLALARAHAPIWQIETEGDFDQPAAPILRNGRPTADTSRPLTYFLPAFTRFGDKVLPQLVYVVWFTERPKEGAIDSYAGALDGVVWRVTLDSDGKPLLYDTIHPCGCYHYYYTAKPLKRRPQGGFWDEPILFPQEPAPAQPFAIRIQARTHYVRRLVPLDAAGSVERRTYELADYAELLTLADGRGGTRSLFREDGLAGGTERFERFWLWPAGIESAGAMRQWGRHATSFVGRSHFDDPAMLDRLFEAP